ncbi:DUF3137 domain-containing protein [Vibrio sp. CAIM 722]|uniref:DUF3137 domain-containing protein n=1 Tax=Vibrio eleionomae TaxID=2653505 RepID=A0A7X4LLT8_9VIBR|nr:DUF3137 domain-containing protein [Vibrio eleionomae]MZI94289.1 DUF3137 domain-containing protein [Vibrio eleionomae]
MNLQELEAAFETDYKPKLAPLDKRRTKAVMVMLIGILIFPIIGFIDYEIIRYNNYDPRIGLAIFGVAVFIYHSYFSSVWGDYRNHYKIQVMETMLATMFPNLEYTPNGHIESKLYKKSELYDHHFDSIQGEDYIEGNIGKTAIQFCELESKYKTTSQDSKGHTKTDWHTIFKGVFFIADFNKRFSSELFIVPEGGLFSSIGKMFGSDSNRMGTRVTLENPDFEKLFEVYGSDQTDARYILSPTLMERLVEFRRSFINPIRISFIDGKLFIAIESNVNHFEPSLFTPATSFSVVKEFYGQLKFLTDIVEDLDLNTRIWTKK